MSPEQVLDKPVDEKTDLWALGVLLYETLTGIRPFERGENAGVGHAIAHAHPLSLRSRRADVPEELAALVASLLAKDPSQRPSADSVVQMLETMQQHGLARPHPPRNRRRRRLLFTIAFGSAGLVLATVLAISLNDEVAVERFAAESKPRRIAVLPFTNQTDKGNDNYLPFALADAISTELARIHSLAVPSSRSILMLPASRQTLPDAAHALGVPTLGGSLKAGPQGVVGEIGLFDPGSRRYLWKRRYTGASALNVQREATDAVIAALKVRLTKAEQLRISHQPTLSATAYDLYLQGRFLQVQALPRQSMDRVPAENIRKAQARFAQAIALDPSFAQAHGQLALAHIVSAYTYDTSLARREQARLEAEIASRIQPGLFEPHEALSHYSILSGDLEDGVREAELAVRDSPSDGERYVLLGNAYRGVDRWDDAIESFQQATRLDPYNSFAFRYASVGLFRMHRVAEGVRALDHAINLRPDDHELALERGYAYLNWEGIPDTLIAAARMLPASGDGSRVAATALYRAMRVQRRYAEAIVMLNQLPGSTRSEFGNYLPRELMRAQMYDGLGKRQAALRDYEAARRLLAKDVSARPDDPDFRMMLALAYAGLGRKENAIAEANRALAAVAPSKGGTATAYMSVAVEVFARVGAVDRAFEVLELLFTMPAGAATSEAYLRVWPGVDRLRSDPRFDQLLERFAPIREKNSQLRK
jgi:serine/threonine-protein kinase